MSTQAVKAVKVKEVKELIADASLAIVTDYRGLTVQEITNLRRELGNDVSYSVVKNTLAKRAIKDTDYEVMSEFFVGPTAVLISKEDQVGPAKVLTQFIKKSKKVTIRGGYLDGQQLTENQVKDLANMPSLDEIRAKMLGSINAPARGIVTCLNGVTKQLVTVFDEIRKQKEAQQ